MLPTNKSLLYALGIGLTLASVYGAGYTHARRIYRGEIAQLQQLQQLALENNQLTSLPPEIGQLQQLQELHLDDNQLATLPPEVGQLQQLQRLWLHSNQLRILPVEITHLQQLEFLDIAENPYLQLIPAHEQFLKGVKEVER